MKEKQVPPSLASFAVGERAELLARIEEQAVEIVAHIYLGAFSDDELGEIDIDLVMPNAERLQQQLVTGDDLTLSLMTVAQHQRIVAAITSPPSDPGTVAVRRELLGRTISIIESNTYYQFGEPQTPCDAVYRAVANELRALLAQEVK